MVPTPNWPSYAPTKALAAGVLSGCSGSLVGMGGAFVAIPALTSRQIALSQHQAQATSLAAVLATGAGGAASFALAGSVDWLAAGAIASGGIVTASAGAKLSSQLPGHSLKGLLGAFMICMSGAVVLKPYLLDKDRADLQAGRGSDGVEAELWPQRLFKLAAIGCGVGVFAGVFGVGGGAITVPAVSVCMPELSHHQAVGTSCAAMVLPAASGLARHAQTGALVGWAALPLALGTVFGAFFGGRHIALELDEITLRTGFAILLATLGGRTLQGAAALRMAAVRNASK